MYTRYKPTKEKNTDLVTLVSLGSVEAVKEKLEAGWDPNVKSRNGISPVLKAAERNDLEMLKILIEAGARVDDKDLAGGFTPLELAHMNENEAMIKLIEENIHMNREEPLVKLTDKLTEENRHIPRTKGTSIS